ncbi:hypothetical protein VCRA2120E57_80034 [Vibrio crassostreae]|nr:hypothetical protein VCRA2120E57_80034 [Vibrio crassostreae]
MSLRAMFHHELHVITSQATFIVIPTTHEKAESQSTTHMETALRHYQPHISTCANTAQKRERFS